MRSLAAFRNLPCGVNTSRSVFLFIPIRCQESSRRHSFSCTTGRQLQLCSWFPPLNCVLRLLNEMARWSCGHLNCEGDVTFRCYRAPGTRFCCDSQGAEALTVPAPTTTLAFFQIVTPHKQSLAANGIPAPTCERHRHSDHAYPAAQQMLGRPPKPSMLKINSNFREPKFSKSQNAIKDVSFILLIVHHKCDLRAHGFIA